MRLPLSWIVAAVLVAAVTSAAMGTVVRDRVGNPGIQSGGHTLTSHAVPPVPYSLIAATTPYPSWSWPWFTSFMSHHRSWFTWFPLHRGRWFTSFTPHHVRPHPPY